MNILSNYPQIIEEMNLIEETLLRSIRSKQPLVTKATQDLLKSGGKRLRPLLMVLSAMQGEYDRKKIIPLAAAIEILHMATLIHDDIIDDAHLRRGSPTIQSKWGKDIAVFTGDFLFCKAFLLISGYNDIENTKKLARAIRVVCEGEIQQYHYRYRTDLSVIGYLKRIAAKTAILFSVSCYIGAYEAKCNRKLVNALANFGMNMGMAFQITDDILDFTGENVLMGKPASNDYTQGIYTLPIIYALQNGDYSKMLKEYLLKEQHTDETFIQISNIAFQSGGVDYARKLAKKYLDKAQRNLKALPEGASRDIMQDVLDKLINRRT
jgi:heptaprenyl diphosphate synthase